MNDTHDTPQPTQPLPNRDLGSANVKSRQNDTGVPVSWMERAVAATTVGELYDAARAAQASGEWNDDHAAWCRLLRAKLADPEYRAVALVVRDLGARPVEERAA